MSVYVQKFLTKDLPFSGQFGVPIIASSFGYQTIRVRGQMLDKEDSSFYVSLQSGGSTKGTDDSVLYIKAISTDNKPRLSFNTFANVWAREEECCEKAINPGEDFELAIVCEHRLYKIFVNGVFIHRFNHRYATERVSHIVVDGDLVLQAVERELPGDLSSAMALLQSATIRMTI